MVRVGKGAVAPLQHLSAATCFLVLSLTRRVYGNNMCSILDQRTAIVDDRLFFCSGNYTFESELTGPHATSLLYWIHLNDTFDVTGTLDTEADMMGSRSLPTDSLSGETADVGGYSGAFFYDHTMLYPYAGMVGPEKDVPSDIIMAFNSSSDSWAPVQVRGGAMVGNNSEGVFASDPRTGASFYTGGWGLAYNGMSNGTVEFQSRNSGSPEWDFKTASGGGIQGPNILKGSMVYVRRGKAGVLLAFGGYQTAYPGTTIPNWPWDQRPFEEIFIYDIWTRTWYHQTATGEIPDMRTEFCAAVSSAPDDSSFQITIHGGWDPRGERAFNDVWVLSVPSFRWIRVEDSDNPDLRGPDKPGRNRHKCNMWNETSMIVTGGQITLGEGEGNTTWLTQRCNTSYPPIKVLDTSTYIWQDEFDPRRTYSVPDVVTAVIGGDSSGGALLTSPENNWEWAELETIFGTALPRDTYVPAGRSSASGSSKPGTPSTPNEPSSSDGAGDAAGSGPESSSNSSSSGNSNSFKKAGNDTTGTLTTGSIIGIVLGAAAFVVATTSLLIFHLRSLTKRSTSAAAASSSAKQNTHKSKGGKFSNTSTPTPPSTTTTTTMIPRFMPWRKPELDAVAQQRYELPSGSDPYEVHGDDVARERIHQHRNQSQQQHEQGAGIGAGSDSVDSRRAEANPACSATLWS